MIRWLIFSSFLFLTVLSCQNSLTSKKVIINDSELLYGPTSIKQIYYDFPAWETIEQEYQADAEIIQKLSELTDSYNVKIFLATWCSDSRREVPHYFKIIKESHLKNKINTRIWAVDRKLLLLGTLAQDHKISKVATFIFYRDNKEIDRIVESPNSLTLEQDIYTILSGK